MIRIRLYGPRNLRDSGLALYHWALYGCLAKDGRFRVEQASWDEAGPHFDGLDAVLWCGLPKEVGQARRVVELMASAPPAVVQVLVPEWEETPVRELVAITAKLRSRRLLIVGLNNADVAPQMTAQSDLWTSAYIPTPLAEPALACAVPRRSHKRQLRAIYVGRDTPRKRLRLVLETWSLPDVNAAAELTLFISGPFDSGRSEVNAKFVEIVSDQPTDERFGWYGAADMFISASSFEHGPIAPIDAMARGCVPVLADSPGHRDLAARSGSCILFEGVEDLRRVVLRLHNDPTELASLSEQGIAYVQREHSPSRIADSLAHLIEMW